MLKYPSKTQLGGHAKWRGREGDGGGPEKRLSSCKVGKTRGQEDKTNFNYQSQHANILPEDIVESLKCMQGVMEHLCETEDETLKKIPRCYQANGVRESGELNFLACG